MVNEPVEEAAQESSGKLIGARIKDKIGHPKSCIIYWCSPQSLLRELTTGVYFFSDCIILSQQ